jgi:hypothetical protein
MDSVIPPSDNDKGKKSMDTSRHEKFAMAASYADDLAQSRNAVPPPPAEDVAYNNPDWPICASCSRPMEHYSDDHRYRCNFCTVAVHENHVRQSSYVLNREKTLAEKAAMSPEDQLREIATTNTLREQYRTTKSRLATQSGADHESGNTTAAGGYRGGNVPGGGSFYQIADIRQNARKMRDRDAAGGRYSDHTRSSGSEPYAEPHPLDRELIDKGFRITASTELNRLPNSPGALVPKNISGGERKPYDRYGQQSNSNGVDVYDGV